MTNSTARSLLDRITDIDGYVPSRLTIGAPATGKSQLLSDAGTLLRLKFPNAQMVYISAGFMAGKDDYCWRFVNESAAYSFKDLTSEEKVFAYKRWTEILSTFHEASCDAKNPKILIVDEIDIIIRLGKASVIGQTFSKLLMDKLVLAATMGLDSGYVLWVSSSIGNVSVLGLSSDLIRALNPVYLTKYGVVWKATNYKAAVANGVAPGIPPIGFRENERIIGIDGAWESLP